VKLRVIGFGGEVVTSQMLFGRERSLATAGKMLLWKSRENLQAQTRPCKVTLRTSEVLWPRRTFLARRDGRDRDGGPQGHVRLEVAGEPAFVEDRNRRRGCMTGRAAGAVMPRPSPRCRAARAVPQVPLPPVPIPPTASGRCTAPPVHAADAPPDRLGAAEPPLPLDPPDPPAPSDEGPTTGNTDPLRRQGENSAIVTSLFAFVILLTVSSLRARETSAKRALAEVALDPNRGSKKGGQRGGPPQLGDITMWSFRRQYSTWQARRSNRVIAPPVFRRSTITDGQ